MSDFKKMVREYVESYKLQLKEIPKYKKVMNPELVVFQKQMYDMNPVYFRLMGKIELAEKLLIDFGVVLIFALQQKHVYPFMSSRLNVLLHSEQ